MASESPSADARKAVRIGKYEIIKHIATGGMGAVYRARDTEEDREIALKVLTPEMAAKPAMLERFKREARSAQKLQHENIVTIYECGETNGTHYIAMEFVEGIDLYEFILKKKGKGLDPEESRQLMIQATRALEHAHANGIIHRDIKPSNFLLQRKNNKLVVKMTDLGLALDVQSEEFRVTRDGTTVGTVDYIAPEQAKDSKAADIRSDLYSLGCTWYHMLAGRPPFPEGGLAERLCKHMMDTPPDIRKFNPRISRDLTAVLAKLLAKEPSDRYQNPSELLVALVNLTAVAELEPTRVLDLEPVGGEAIPNVIAALAEEAARSDTVADDEEEEEEETPPRGHSSGKNRPVAGKRKPPSSQTLRKNPPSSGAAEKINARKTSPAEVPVASPRPRPVASKPRPEPKPRPELEEDEEEKPTRKSNPLQTVLLGAAVILAMGIIVAIGSLMSPKPKPVVPTQVAVNPEPQAPVDPPPPPQNNDPEPNPPPPNPDPANADPPPTKGVQPPPVAKINNPANPAPAPVKQEPSVIKTVPGPPKKASVYKPLFKLNEPEDAARLVQRIEEPFSKVPVLPQDAPVLRLVRAQDGQPGTFTTLQAACDAPQTARGAVIEICDNGPIYEVGATITGKRLHLRAGKGYRPLLVWDVHRILAERRARKKGETDSLEFLSTSKGGLTLEGLEIVLRWPESAAPDSIAFLQATESDLAVRRCVFSISPSTQIQKPVTLARFLSSASKEPVHLRLSSSFIRGSNLTVLDTQAAVSQVCIEDSLIAGGAPSLLQIKATDDRVCGLSLVRSTLVCSQNVLAVQPATATDQKPAVQVIAWDSLLSRSNISTGGDLVAVAGESSRLKWEAVNCLYAGWQNLLKDRSQALPSRSIAEWQQRWQKSASDLALGEAWPSQPYQDLSDKSAGTFRTQDSKPDVCFARSTNPDRPLGCDLDQLPATRDSWAQLTHERWDLFAFDPPPDKLPDILEDPDGKYTGERKVLDKIMDKGFDLGQYLTRKQEDQPFASRVVMRLAGSGEFEISPFQVPKGTSLVLCVEPPDETRPDTPAPTPTVGAAKPPEKLTSIVLIQKRSERKQIPALIDVVEGDLEMINVELRLPDDSFAQDLPQWMLRIRNGNLKLHRCRLTGPQFSKPDGYKGLIHLTGSGSVNPEQVRLLQLSESVLSSSQNAIDLSGIGIRFKAEQSLLVAGAQVLHLDLTKDFKGIANTQVVLERTTLGARQVCLFLKEAPTSVVPTEPVFVYTSACAFLTPFAGSKTGLVLAQGSAFAQGQLIWRGKADILDPRLHYLVASDKDIPKQRQAPEAWSQFWRYPTRDSRLPLEKIGLAKLDEKPRKAWALEQLAIPLTTGSRDHDRRAGADLELLGLLKKTPRK